MPPPDGTDERVYGGRYELRRGIARGGMADVFLAHDRLLDRPVALKVLFPELSSDRSFVERFRREAQAAANLGHPSIVSVFDWGEEADTYYIVMEYVDGRSLSDIIRTEGPLLGERAADIAGEIAGALASAHRAGVIHRDVKPGNVLIAPNGQVKVTDFGIARAVSAAEGLTQTGTVMGTATYFSPEQAQGHPVDPRSDLYSLGVVLYEMLTGRPPFSGDGPVAVAYKHVKEDPVPVRERNPDVHPDIERIVHKALAKNPANRYQSAEELAADLRRFREGRAVLAEPVMAALAADPTVAHQAYRDATQAVPTAAMTPPPTGTTPVPVRESRTGVYVAVMIILLLLLGLLIFFLAQALDGEGGAEVTVPSVIGFEAAEAVTTLEELGLEVNQQFEPNEETPEGVVFGQEPDPGTRVGEGDEVTIRISQGEAPIDVPDVVGDNVDDATDELEGLGFEVVVMTEPSDDVPEGEVLAQDPEAGQQIPPGSTVTLTVSSGVEEVEVPDVSGLTLAEAANRLGQAGFQTAEASEPSDTVPEGRVISTDPAAGTTAERGTTVTVIVSSGPATTTVPSVVGDTEQAARSELEAAGFEVEVVDQVTSEPGDDGIVLDQDPDGGTSAPVGSTVTITVGRFLGNGSGDEGGGDQTSAPSRPGPRS